MCKQVVFSFDNLTSDFLDYAFKQAETVRAGDVCGGSREQRDT